MKNRVKELRTAAGMTQQQLADRVHVSSRTIISLEKELYNPSLLLAYRIAELFGVTAAMQRPPEPADVGSHRRTGSRGPARSRAVDLGVKYYSKGKVKCLTV